MILTSKMKWSWHENRKYVRGVCKAQKLRKYWSSRWNAYDRTSCIFNDNKLQECGGKSPLSWPQGINVLSNMDMWKFKNREY